MWGESTSYCCQASLPKAGLDTAATLLGAEVGAGGGVSILPRRRLACGIKSYASRWYPQPFMGGLYLAEQSYHTLTFLQN